MLNVILSALASKTAKSLVDNFFLMFAKRAMRSALADMIVDLCLDEMENALEESGASQEEVEDMRDDRRETIEDEVEVRLSAIFRALS